MVYEELRALLSAKGWIIDYHTEYFNGTERYCEVVVRTTTGDIRRLHGRDYDEIWRKLLYPHLAYPTFQVAEILQVGDVAILDPNDGKLHRARLE